MRGMAEPNEYGYYTVEEIIRIYHVKRSYLYRLACVHRWGRYRHPDGSTRYRRAAVDDTLRPGADRRMRIGQVKSGLDGVAV